MALFKRFWGGEKPGRVPRFGLEGDFPVFFYQYLKEVAWIFRRKGYTSCVEELRLEGPRPSGFASRLDVCLALRKPFSIDEAVDRQNQE
jgi:hypothetical protein